MRNLGSGHFKFLGLLGVWVLAGCSGPTPHPQIFFGECQIQVVSKTKEAEILIDGIVAGTDSVKVQTPCGEKQVRVERHGYLPYESYVPVSVDQPVKVTVELEHARSTPDYALSRELIAQIRTGKKLRNPWLEGGAANEKEDAPEELPTTAAPTKASTTGGAPQSGGGAASTNVEDWR